MPGWGRQDGVCCCCCCCSTPAGRLEGCHCCAAAAALPSLPSPLLRRPARPAHAHPARLPPCPHPPAHRSPACPPSPPACLHPAHPASPPALTPPPTDLLLARRPVADAGHARPHPRTGPRAGGRPCLHAASLVCCLASVSWTRWTTSARRWALALLLAIGCGLWFCGPPRANWALPRHARARVAPRTAGSCCPPAAAAAVPPGGTAGGAARGPHVRPAVERSRRPLRLGHQPARRGCAAGCLRRRRHGRACCDWRWRAAAAAAAAGQPTATQPTEVGCIPAPHASPSASPAGYTFGQDISEQFNHTNGLTLVSRAHQLVSTHAASAAAAGSFGPPGM